VSFIAIHTRGIIPKPCRGSLFCIGINASPFNSRPRFAGSGSLHGEISPG
jgi:hypothetical protein